MTKTVVLTLQLQFEDSIPTALIHREVQRKVGDFPGLRSVSVRAMPYYMPLIAPSGNPSILGIRTSALSHEQARRNHSQDLHRLHDRGGLDAVEALSVVQCTGYRRELSLEQALQTLYRTSPNPLPPVDTYLG